ncbi:MAG: hypothetical protein NZ534_10725, partial [Bacteroidia bacterium]|nr:hypothetical protein [Bacteroidia bacterium]
MISTTNASGAAAAMISTIFGAASAAAAFTRGRNVHASLSIVQQKRESTLSLVRQRILTMQIYKKNRFAANPCAGIVTQITTGLKIIFMHASLSLICRGKVFEWHRGE